MAKHSKTTTPKAAGKTGAGRTGKAAAAKPGKAGAKPEAAETAEAKPKGEAARSMIPGPAATASTPMVQVEIDLECDDFKAACDAHEKRLLEAALRRCRFNQRLTAKALSLTYDQLRHALRRHDLLQAGAS